MSFKLPPKYKVCNDNTKYAPSYQDAAGAATTAALATQMYIPGLGMTKVAHLTEVNLTRGLSPQFESWDIAPGDLTVAGTIPDGTELWIEYTIGFRDREMRNATVGDIHQRPHRAKIVVNDADTAADILDKIYTALVAKYPSFNNPLVSPTRTPAPGGGAITNLNFSLQDRAHFIKKPRLTDTHFRVLGSDGSISSYLSIGNTAPDNAAIKGIGYGEDVEFMYKIQGSNDRWAYGFDRDDVPIANQLYTKVQWKIAVSRQDPQYASFSNEVEHFLYLNELSAATMINGLADFFMKASVITQLGTGNEIQIGVNDAPVIATEDPAGVALTAGDAIYTSAGPSYYFDALINATNVADNLTQFKANA